MKINEIEFINDDVDKNLKKNFSALFDLEKFNLDDFLLFIEKNEQLLLNKNVEIHREHSKAIEQIDQATVLSINKNNNEITAFQGAFDENSKNLHSNFNTYDKTINDLIFELSLNTELSKSNNADFFDEEIKQIDLEINAIKKEYAISLARLEKEKETKIDLLNNHANKKLNELNENIDNLSMPYETKKEVLKENLILELKNKDETYLTIKKTHNQSSVKFNNFISQIKNNYKMSLMKLEKNHLNKINDLKLDLEDLDDYFETAKEVIRENHLEKLKALDIVFDVHKIDHKNSVNELIKDNAQQVTNINANFRELRNNLNIEIDKKEKEKNKLLLTNKDFDSRKEINVKYSKLINPLKKEIIKINNLNDLKLIEQNIIFETKMYNQDLKHLNHVNEWRYTRDNYEAERNNKLAVEEAKYNHEKFIINEKINNENKLIELVKIIENLKMEKELLPIESQLYFSSSLQTRDINLLNTEFDAFKLNNELELKILKLEYDLERLFYSNDIELLKEALIFDLKILEVTYQLYIEKNIIKRNKDINVLLIQKDLQNTLLLQKNIRQDNIKQGKINEQNLIRELKQKETDYLLKKGKNELNLEIQKRTFIIYNIKNRVQRTKGMRQSERKIALAKNNTELNEVITKYVFDHLFNNLKHQQTATELYFDALKSTIHPGELRKIYQIIKSFTNELLKDSIQALVELEKYEQKIFTNQLRDITDSNHRFKHGEIINTYSDIKHTQKEIINDLQLKITAINADNDELLIRNKHNQFAINTTNVQSKSKSLEEKKQIKLLNAEIKANNIVIRNNNKYINNLNNQIKIHEKALLTLTSKQIKAEDKLHKEDKLEQKNHLSFINKHKKEYQSLLTYLNNNQTKFESIFSSLNTSTYFDDKAINQFIKSIKKYFNEVNLNLINYTFRLLKIWKNFFLLTEKDENDVINKFEQSTNKAIKENEANYNKYQNLILNDMKFIDNLYLEETKRINDELKQIKVDTDQNVTDTHNTYYTYYNQTENKINNLEKYHLHQEKVITNNLNEVIKVLNSNKTKSLTAIMTKQNKVKTKHLTDLILNKDEIKLNESKTDKRYSLTIYRYNNNRKNYINTMKKKRISFDRKIDGLKTSINVNFEAMNIKVKRNLKITKQLINDLEIKLIDQKSDNKRVRKKEARENKVKLKNSLKFKNKQIRRKFKWKSTFIKNW